MAVQSRHIAEQRLARRALFHLLAHDRDEFVLVFHYSIPSYASEKNFVNHYIKSLTSL